MVIGRAACCERVPRSHRLWVCRESNCIVAAVETSLPELLQLSGGRTLSLARIGHVGSVPHRAAVRGPPRRQGAWYFLTRGFRFHGPQSHAQKCGLLRVTAAEITTTTMHMREPKPRAVLERQYNGIMALRRRRAQLAVEQTFPPVVRLIRHFFGGCTLHLMVAVDFGVQRTVRARGCTCAHRLSILTAQSLCRMYRGRRAASLLKLSPTSPLLAQSECGRMVRRGAGGAPSNTCRCCRVQVLDATNGALHWIGRNKRVAATGVTRRLIVAFPSCPGCASTLAANCFHFPRSLMLVVHYVPVPLAARTSRLTDSPVRSTARRGKPTAKLAT